MLRSGTVLSYGCLLSSHKSGRPVREIDSLNFSDLTTPHHPDHLRPPYHPRKTHPPIALFLPQVACARRYQLMLRCILVTLRALWIQGAFQETQLVLTFDVLCHLCLWRRRRIFRVDHVCITYVVSSVECTLRSENNLKILQPTLNPFNPSR